MNEAVDTLTLPEADRKTTVRRQPPYNVILLDDDDHSYDYVIRMLRILFGYSIERSFEMATKVDNLGRVILMTTTREHAELKRDQVHAFGVDPLIETCQGSMTAVLEASPR